MRPLTLDDLLPLEEYASRRGEFFATHRRYLDRYRRVRLGPRLTVVFENRQTLWFRVQELLQVARLAEPHRRQHQLDLHNQLLPSRGRLQAALLLDCGVDKPNPWPELHGNDLWLVLGTTRLPAQLVTCRAADLTVGTAHWVQFPVEEQARRSLADFRVPACLQAHFPAYQHEALLSEDVRQSLLDDLDLSERDP